METSARSQAAVLHARAKVGEYGDWWSGHTLSPTQEGEQSSHCEISASGPVSLWAAKSSTGFCSGKSIGVACGSSSGLREILALGGDVLKTGARTLGRCSCASDYQCGLLGYIRARLMKG